MSLMWFSSRSMTLYNLKTPAIRETYFAAPRLLVFSSYQLGTSLDQISAYLTLVIPPIDLATPLHTLSIKPTSGFIPHHSSYRLWHASLVLVEEACPLTLYHASTHGKHFGVRLRPRGYYYYSKTALQKHRGFLYSYWRAHSAPVFERQRHD